MRGDRLLWVPLLGVLGLPGVGMAQSVIVPDDTLGVERSVIEVQPTGELIIGGATRGINLFHSFREFNVGEGRSTYFIAPNLTIENILARVTGANRSNILGKLGTAILVDRGLEASNANLFLVNPNGIVFGQNSSLDVDKSFTATTANAIEFGDRGVFSATNPTNAVPLLTVNPSAYLFSQVPTGNIVNRSVDRRVGSRVPDGQSLTLLGGDINVQGGIIVSSGRIELGSVSGSGIVELEPNGHLRFAPKLLRGNVALTQQSVVAVAGNNGGDIVVTSGNIQVSNSQLLAGIAPGFGIGGSQAGNLTLDATGEIRIEQDSIIANSVFSQSIGNAGNLLINAGSLNVTGRSKLSTSTLGRGNAGDVIINVRDRIFLDDNNTFISSVVGTNAIGQGGNIKITTDFLEVMDGAQLLTSTDGTGDAGDLIINASSLVNFNASNAFSSVESGGNGDGGNIRISTDSLTLTNGSELIANTAGIGNAGNVIINARNLIILDGSSPDGQLGSAILSNVDNSGNGKGGDVRISTGSLILTNGTRLSSSSFGNGDAGSVIINARDRVDFDGTSSNGTRSSGAFTSSGDFNSGGQGNAGNIYISTGSLRLSNGAQLSSRIFTTGNAGNIVIDARDQVSLDGASKDGRLISSATSSVGDGGNGKGGDVHISTGSLSLTNGAILSAQTRGIGDAGNVIINARDRITFDSSGAKSDVSSSGNGRGGDVRVSTNSLTLTNGAYLSSGTNGLGNAGNVIVNAFNAVSVDASYMFSSVGSNGNAKGGDIIISTGSLIVENGSGLGAFSLGNDAGNVILNVHDRTIFDASNVFTTIGETGNGKGGNIMIAAGSLTLTNDGGLSATTYGTGNAGNIQINLRDDLQAYGSSILTFGQTEAGGSITVSAKNIRLRQNSDIASFTFGNSNGGNIGLTANTIIALEDSDILSFARNGRGGNITLNTPAFFGQNYRHAPPNTDPATLDGNDRVDINASGTVSGILLLPDTSFIQSNLNQLSSSGIDTNQLLAKTCLIRQNQPQGTFYITGTGGISNRPNDPALSAYSTNTIQPTTQTAQRPWKLGDPIVESQGFYKLANGRLVMSRECSQ